MSKLKDVKLPDLDTLKAELLPPGTLRLGGTIACQDPGRRLGDFFKSVHQAATEDKLAEVCVDVTELTFINSSAIRLFVDWAIRVRDDAAHRYTLKFQINRQITWQRTSFTALMSLTGGVLKIEHVA